MKVGFVYEDFVEKFPEFEAVSKEICRFWFECAEGIVNNSCCSRVPDKLLDKLLYLLTAHYLALVNRGSTATGSIASASEGSVSVSYAQQNAGNAGWYSQTQYGLMFWQLILPYRTGRWIA